MRLFNLLLLWCSVLSTYVLANNRSLPYELIYFYYAYKFQWESGVERTIAVGCAPSSNKGDMCYFDQFVKHLIEDNWPYNPPTADHTTTPGKDQVAAITQKITSSGRYYLKQLMAQFSHEMPFTVVLETILDAANTALNVEKYKPSNADIKQAIKSVQTAQSERYETYAGIEDEALQMTIPAAAYDYVSSDGKANYDWYETLEDIDKAVYAEKITNAQGEEFKAAILDFSQNIDARIFPTPTDDEIELIKRQGILEHLRNIRVMGTTVNELNNHVVAESAASGDSPRAPSYCGSDDVEFAFSDGSNSE
ncbi:uncharacterized protein N7498_003079 [Penicillium cinerascens]|uniref:Uncharacterized protein n=1 Tax=Penicillium cinerascens TaxID=70096 RepID=A0A9W9N2G3_9EURO|nr:uncharacterized protein N7498_003079 [Penicillium cinerascens]KAJ5211433.1 hypothetical protein N7498_003079 [Penicillium cinerascens]